MKHLVSLLLLSLSLCVCGQRVVSITSIPNNTPDGEPIHLAGDPNGWNPGDPDWIFTEIDGEYFYQLPVSTADLFEGKITRGSWATVEGNASGGFLPNRTFDFTSTDTVFIEVLTWEGDFEPTDLPDNLVVFDEDFYMPELDRTRRIRVLLPNDYDETELDYPVLYMHDGQNLFSDQESFAGEWEIDEALMQFEDDGYEGAIVVAIDNGGAMRIDEYTPYPHPTYGGGDGAAYVEFIVNTLKPAIDEEYRTLTDREHTGIMGSSLGGLISFYAGIKYQDVFSKVGVFSPSFWFNDSIYDFAEEIGSNSSMQFYFLAGGQESASLEFEVLSMIGVMEDEGFQPDEINFQFVPEGQHSEWFWAQEFPDAFEWLYLSTPLFTSAPAMDPAILYPNPAGEFIRLANATPDWDHYRIYNSLGRLILEGKKNGDGGIDLSTLPSGYYRFEAFGSSTVIRENFIKL